MIEEQYRASQIEAMIMASSEPLPARRIAKITEDTTPSIIARAVASLNTGYAERGASFRIRELAGGYQLYLLPEYLGVVESLFARQRKLRLSRAALETIAIIAYRQPTSKIDIEHIRGVASDGVIRTLLERSLVTITGRADTVGKPLQYGTTDDFLKFFGLASLDDLPKMSEIEQMISSAESKNQAQLEFAVGGEDELVKLNIADGTFDPERRQRLEDGDDLSDDLPPASSAEETRSDESEPETPERKLVLTGEAEPVPEREAVIPETVELVAPVEVASAEEPEAD